MSHIIVNPDGLHDPVPFGYSHNATIPAGTELVLVAGSVRIEHGRHGCLARLHRAGAASLPQPGVAPAAHGLDLSHVVQLRTYVVNLDFDKLPGAAVNRYEQQTGG